MVHQNSLCCDSTYLSKCITVESPEVKTEKTIATLVTMQLTDVKACLYEFEFKSALHAN